jgi:hypothetical protein
MKAKHTVLRGEDEGKHPKTKEEAKRWTSQLGLINCGIAAFIFLSQKLMGKKIFPTQPSISPSLSTSPVCLSPRVTAEI